jgi:hypothetical protein
MSNKAPNTPPNQRHRPDQVEDDPFAQLPTETEIYILPSGEIVVADLPVELAARLGTEAFSDLESHD